MTKVSIIMPSLNVVEYIKVAIESAQCQTLKDIEIICVDAGSTDGSLEYIIDAMKEDRRIVLIKSPIKSYGYQVNLGIAKAKGEYIAILETDDYVCCNMYNELYTVASEEKLDYVKCNYDTYSFDDKNNKVFTQRKISDNSILYEKNFIPREHMDVPFDDWYLWNGIYRTAFLKDNNIKFSETKGAAFQDIGFLHKTTTRANSAKYVNHSFYRYCVGRGESSSKSNKAIFYVGQEYCLLFDNIDCADEIEKSFLYRRMAKSFTRACMDCCDEDLEKVEVLDIIKWFQIKLSYAQKEGYVSKNMLPIGLQKTYMYLTNSIAEYKVYRKNRISEIKEFIGNGNLVVIFGCGIYGKEALEYLNNIGIEVDVFMDNSSELWGTTIRGIAVENPDRIKDMNREARYVVANEKYANDIAVQISNSIDGAHIFLF